MSMNIHAKNIRSPKKLERISMVDGYNLDTRISICIFSINGKFGVGTSLGQPLIVRNIFMGSFVRKFTDNQFINDEF